MACEPEPHPETDQTGETIEFEPIPPPEYVWVDASRADEVFLAGICEYPVEIRVGQTTETSPLLLDEGWHYEELCEAAGVEPNLAYVLVQPDVMKENPERGWIIIPSGETVSIGRGETPQFRLGKEVARKGHLEIENNGRRPQTEREVRIAVHGSNPVKVRVKNDFTGIDHRFLW